MKRRLPQVILAHLPEFNPIFLKEIRQSLRSKVLIGGLMLYLFGLVCITGLIIASAVNTHSFNLLTAKIGSSLAASVGCCLFLLNLLIALLFHLRMDQERQQAQTELYLLSAISPGRIIRGKLLAGTFLLLEYYSLALPFLLGSYLFRGVDIGTLLIMIICGLLLGTLLISGLLTLALLPFLKFIRGLLILFSVFFLFSLLPALSYMLYRRSVGSAIFSSSFWQGMGLIFLGWLTAIGLCYTISVALLSPLFSNRMFPTRILLFIAAMVWGGIGVLAHFDQDAMVAWGVIVVLLAAFLVGIGISEPDAWSLRIRRRIPRFRLLAFPFFSGAPNALAWMPLLVILTGIILFSSSCSLTPTCGVVLIGGYFFAYSLLANWVRRRFFQDKPREKRIAYTWGVYSALMILIQIILPIVREAGEFKHLPRIGDWESCFSSSYLEENLIFLGILLVIGTALNLGWFIKRIQAFRRPEFPVPTSQTMINHRDSGSEGEPS